MAECKVFACTCKSEFHDKTYGKGQRLFNPRQMKKSDKVTGYRCSVCGKEVNLEGK